jgi:hypothetical protein
MTREPTEAEKRAIVAFYKALRRCYGMPEAGEGATFDDVPKANRGTALAVVSAVIRSLREDAILWGRPNARDDIAQFIDAASPPVFASGEIDDVVIGADKGEAS